MNNGIGKVFLVGAGPGDEELLTLKAERLIKNARLVIYDRLISKNILAKIPYDAITINVGKTSSAHPIPQDEINKIILNKALEGYEVIRLKGGDSFLFGRGGEELNLLAEHGIPFEVVPGITSPIAAAAYAGIPVTHRDFCSSLHIITGHRRNNGELKLNYRALTELSGTLIFLMAISSSCEIMNGLIEAGMQKSMPCAVVENGTLPTQRKFIGTVATIYDIIKNSNIHSPALIIVGEVCVLADKFDWFSNLPLFGKRILVTRPKADSNKLSAKLKSLGADICSIPANEIVSIKFNFPDLAEYTTLIFTSAEGVSRFFTGLITTGLDARGLCGKQIAVIGKETAAVLLNYGIRADYVPTTFNSETLANELISKEIINKNDKVLIFHAKNAAPKLTEILAENSISYKEICVYETKPIKTVLDEKNFDIITFTSAACVKSFFANGLSENGKTVVCIGEYTAKEAIKHGMKPFVAKEATIDSMIELILNLE